MRAGQICTCPITTMELLYSARDAHEFAQWEQDLSILRSVPTTQSVFNAAVGALRDLSLVSPVYHRVSLPDALIAASAQDVGVGVLQYDEPFDRLAQVIHSSSRWLAPRGTL